MLPAFFHRTELDRDFYDRYLRDRLPAKLMDAHQHLVKKVFIENVDPRLREQDWAGQCYEEMPVEDAEAVADALFPGKIYERNALTTVTKGSDFDRANDYLATLLREGRARYAMMTLDPAWSDYEAEKRLLEGGFTGFKPYPDLVSGRKGAEISIFDCAPRSKLAILNRNKKAMTLHIPRAGRLGDPDNARELKEIRDRYPDIRLIVAHLGRSYAVGVFERGLTLLGDYAKEMCFDLAAVLNPEVLGLAFRELDVKRLLWGTDLPVFTWHGRRRWTRESYHNLAREDFPWNAHEEGPEKEAAYTYFLYEQAKNILDILPGDYYADVFYDNAERLLGAAAKGE